MSQAFYRRDIDGLRALAVLSVVAYHAFPTWFVGGFVGVDVFFVISGYVITANILRDLSNGTFSFINFYRGRVRRLFPSLILVVGVVLSVTWYILLPEERSLVGRHVAGSSFFILNFILIGEVGYFDFSSIEKPLLHLWSLAVEEQFYLLWPIILFFTWLTKKRVIPTYALIFFASFSFNLLFIRSFPEVVFFSPFGRVWEFFLGAGIASLSFYDSSLSNSTKSGVDINFTKRLILKFRQYSVEYKNFLCLIGVLCLTGSLFIINDSIPHPSFWTLIPVVGAALIILSGPRAQFNKVLFSNRVSVWFGLISYPLYLWHWPILSVLNIFIGEFPSRFVRIIAILASIGLAWLTFHFLERPIRFGKRSLGRELVICSLLFFLGGLGVLVDSNGGFRSADSPNRYSDQFGHKAFFDSLKQDFLPCSNKDILHSSNKYLGWPRCVQTKVGIPSVILLGDSHAEHLFHGFSTELPDQNIAYYARGGRPTLEDTEFEDIFSVLLSVSKTNNTVIISTLFSQDFPYGERLDELRVTISELQKRGYRIAVLADVPSFQRSPVDCVRPYTIRGKGRLEDCNITRREMEQQNRSYEPYLISLLDELGVDYFPFDTNLICNSSQCSMVSSGKLIYRDSHHLNLFGSEMVAKNYVDRLKARGFFR